MADNVNHPSHYIGDNGIECIDAMEAAFGKESVATFCKCNAFKYLFRNNIKQQGESILKASWYIDKYKTLMPNEMWVTCVENDAYEVSNTGKVRLKGADKNRKPVFMKNGYATIMTVMEGKPKLFYLHRMVANAFLPNPNNLPVVNHIDHNRANNDVSNLEWCTSKYNVQDGKGNTIYVYDKEKELVEVFKSLRDAEKYFNIAHSSIQRYWLDTNKLYGDFYFYSHPLENIREEEDKSVIDKEIEDLKKAKWYIEDRIKELELKRNEEISKQYAGCCLANTRVV